MKFPHWSLFISGLFFGGTIDHVIFALLKSSTTPYGINLGKSGNWWMALFDLALTAVFFWPFYRYLEKATKRKTTYF
jgi:hypothetical protein